MHNYGPAMLMMNLHSMESFGRVIDEVHTCATSRTRNKIYLDLTECSILSDFQKIYGADGKFRIGAMILQPIYPASDPSEFTGLITSSVVWEDVLSRLFFPEVHGVDCVLKTDTETFTYSIYEGVAGGDPNESDTHDPIYSEYGQTIILNSPGLFGNSSAHYTLTLYPNQNFFELYRTKNPTVALVTTLCVVVFTSIIFFCYDFFVRKEIKQKKEILKVKRQYVRFISHEVRVSFCFLWCGIYSALIIFLTPQCDVILSLSLSSVAIEFYCYGISTCS
jgi:hypothetical protein